jgi:septum formation protein
MESPIPRIVLASNSPRRKQLLALGGWDFQVVAARVDESLREGEKPVVYVSRLAQAKARAALATSLDEVIIAADTIVVVDDMIFGKPEDADQAVWMLQYLRGRTHQVYTGLAVLRNADGTWLSDLCSTDVSMRAYSDAEILAYVSSGDPMDKAGAYAIQHQGFNPARPVQGCYANVVGLPLCNLLRTLKKVGIYARNDVPRVCQAALEYKCPVFEKILEAG